ncbi:MAG: 50S ribosomal protein L25 [Actinobacteria bacterium]|nr:50S ribosomal protein L25 [Actinomycetota bacterium]
MEIVHLKAEYREGIGKSAVKKLRAINKVPAIFYGEGVENIPIALNTKDLKAVMGTETGIHTVLDLEIDMGSKKKVNEKAVIKEIQRSPVRGSYTHVDLFKTDLDKKIETAVPLVTVGEAPGVKEGGLIQHGIREIEVECLVRDMPKHIDVDISNLKMGDVIRVADISKVEGIKFLTHEEEIVVSVIHLVEFKEAEAPAEEVEPEVIGEKEKEAEKASESS